LLLFFQSSGSPLLIADGAPFIARLSQPIAKLQHAGSYAADKKLPAAITIARNPSALHLIK
jgi:hypothetical protein